MPRTRPPYPVEFRRETVELVRQGRSIADVAKSLGVSHQTLRDWCKQIEVDQGRREGLTSDEREEFTQLRRRVLVLEQEREILKREPTDGSVGRVTVRREREHLRPLRLGRRTRRTAAGPSRRAGR